MMGRLGIDLSAIPDLTMRTISGRENLAQALIRRLTTPRGKLFYDPTYGTDIREWINESITDETLYALTTAVAAECEKDERVIAAQVTATPNPTERSIRLEVVLELVGEDDPLRLVLNVSELSVEALYAA